MRGYKVRAIERVNFSQEVLIVSFVDTHGQHFSLPCICERFKELAMNLGPEQLQKTLNEASISVIISHGVIRTVNIETKPLKPDHLSVPFPENSKEREGEREIASTSQRLAPLEMTLEERRLGEVVDEWRRKMNASQVMFCESCESEVPIRRVKRGQFREQFYCNRCNKLLDTINHTD